MDLSDGCQDQMIVVDKKRQKLLYDTVECRSDCGVPGEE